MKQFIVVGLGRFGYNLALTLSHKNYDVLAVDSNKTKIQDISNKVTHAVQLNATDEEALKTLGVSNFEVAIVSIGEDIHSNILATLILKELGVRYVVAKARDKLHGKVLNKLGADRIVYPERDMGVRVANSLISSNVLEYIELSSDYSVIEIKSSKRMYNKTLLHLSLRSNYGVNVVAIKNKSGMNISPKAETVIKPGDVLLVIGENNKLDRLRNI